MKCPLCNMLLNYDPHDDMIECCNMECVASMFGSGGKLFWTDLGNTVKAIRAQAVKQAYKHRRCRTCGNKNSKMCIRIFMSDLNPNFGCIHWMKKGTK